MFGAATARELATRGWAVTIVEAHQPGHVRASSGGESRLIRAGHGTDAWHTDSAWRSLDLWEALGDEVGATVLERCGIAWFARSEVGWEADSLATMRAAGIPAERLSPHDAAELFPSLGTDDLAWILWEPGAGVLHARDAVRALVASATAHGATVVRGQAERTPEGTAAVDRQPLHADTTVWAPGPWLGSLWPGAIDLRVTQQDETYFGTPAGVDWATPGWVDYGASAYGVGDLDGRGIKCASDVEGPDFDPDHDERIPLDANLQRARQLIARRFPALADAPLVGTRTCQYTLTADTRFIAAPAPDTDQVWLTGGGSGHGFKHGPAWGGVVADMVEGRTEPDPRFALGPRVADAALRTSGDLGDA